MNKYRILTAALSSKATVDDFTFCRSSDLLHFRTSFPFLPETVGNELMSKAFLELTAAGLSRIYT